MVVVAIEQRDANRRARERARGVEATEAAAEDDDVGSACRSRFPVLRSQFVFKFGSWRSAFGFGVRRFDAIVIVMRPFLRVSAMSWEVQPRSWIPRARWIVRTPAHSRSRSGTARWWKSTDRTRTPSRAGTSARRSGSSATASTVRIGCSTRRSGRAARAKASSSGCPGTRRWSSSSSACSARRRSTAARPSCRIRTAGRTGC